MTSQTQQKTAAFFSSYRTFTYNKGDTIVHGGIEPKGVMYLVEGSVAQYDILSNGNEAVVNIYKPGAFFPMSWAINHTPNEYFFEAQTNVTIHLAPASDVVTFIQQEPTVAFDLLSRAFRGMDGVLARITHLMAGDARSRVLFELQNAALRFGTPTADGGMKLPMSELDLAKRSGLARETVSRTLKKIKAEGIVVVEQGGSISIPNLSALKQALEL